MAYSEPEIKAQIYSLIPGAMQAEADQLWSAWFREGAASANRDLILRVEALRFLQGKLWGEYNVTTGRDKRESFQKWQAITQMLQDAQDELNAAGGVGGTVQKFAGITNIRAKPLVTTGRARYHHGKGKP